MAEPLRVAAFDCGTNSLRLLIADVDPVAGTMTELVREMRIVRLGEGVDRTGRLSAAALTRTFAVVDGYVELTRRHAVGRVRFCATSAARDADNADEFVRGIGARLGTDPVVLDGDAEARASYLGATRTLGGDVAAPYLVVDIGGGSTELVLGEGEHVLAAESLDIGSVRLTERCFAHDPPSRDDVEACRSVVATALDACHVDLAGAGSVIGVAGTVTTLAAGALGLSEYDREAIHGASIGVAGLRSTIAELLAMDVVRRRDLGYMHPGRADVIGAGGVVLQGILERTPVEAVLISEQDILDGIAWTAATDAATDPQGS